MYFLGISTDVKRAPNQPLVQFSCYLAEPDPNRRTFFAMILAKKSISSVKNQGRTFIPPFGEVPIDIDIFFTVQFENNEKTESFLRHWKK